MAAKKITLRYDGKEYLLEFNRSTAQAIEQRGFVAKEIDETQCNDTAFNRMVRSLLTHSNIKRKDVKQYSPPSLNKDKLIAALVDVL